MDFEINKKKQHRSSEIKRLDKKALYKKWLMSINNSKLSWSDFPEPYRMLTKEFKEKNNVGSI